MKGLGGKNKGEGKGERGKIVVDEKKRLSKDRRGQMMRKNEQREKQK